MSLFSVWATKIAVFFSAKATTKAVSVAGTALQQFITYAQTDEYEALYEVVVRLTKDPNLSGSQKMSQVLTAAAKDVELYGEFFVKGVVELIIAQLKVR